MIYLSGAVHGSLPVVIHLLLLLLLLLLMPLLRGVLGSVRIGSVPAAVHRAVHTWLADGAIRILSIEIHRLKLNS